MTAKSIDEAEGGMVRALLGYQLLNLYDEDLVIFIRRDGFIKSIASLKSKGWDRLEEIYCSDLQ